MKEWDDIKGLEHVEKVRLFEDGRNFLELLGHYEDGETFRRGGLFDTCYPISKIQPAGASLSPV